MHDAGCHFDAFYHALESAPESRLRTDKREKADICGLSWFLNENNRIKCG